MGASFQQPPPPQKKKKKKPGPKINLQESPKPNLRVLKISGKVCTYLFAELRSRDTRTLPRGTTTYLQIVLNTQKYPYLNNATQKDTSQIFLPQKIRIPSRISEL